MQQKPLGTSGLTIAEIGQGTYRFTASPEILRYGVELGGTFIDTAELYKNEDVVGRAVADCRDRVFIATKTRYLRPDEIKKYADQSLARLGTDRIDLYQIHWPRDEVPLEETLGTMEELVDAGKIRYIGVSNFSVELLDKARACMTRYPIVSNQVKYSLVDRRIEPELIDYCAKTRTTIIAYTPLAKGLEHLLRCDPKGTLRSVASETGRTIVQVALNWCVAKDGVVAIPKASTREHVRENLGASDWRLTPEQMGRLERDMKPLRRSRLRVWAGAIKRRILSAVGR